MRKLFVLAAVLGGAAVANAAATPAEKCQAGKTQESGKYVACLAKADAKLLTTAGTCSVMTATECFADSGCGVGETCDKDLTKFNATVGKCEEKFAAKWASLEEKAGGACPDGLLPEDVKEALDECADNVAAGLGGEVLSTCSDDLVTCEGDLATSQAVPQGQRLKTGQTQCFDAAGSVISCPGTGQDGELQNGLTVSFTDNGNGTISDNRTGLMWEKLGDDGSIHDQDTTYTWTTAPSKIAALNSGGGFAGYTDWRQPNISELHSLANYGAVTPAVYPPFNSDCIAGCTVLTCSCNLPVFYRSSTSYELNPTKNWVLALNDGWILPNSKAGSDIVRAVRSDP